MGVSKIYHSKKSNWFLSLRKFLYHPTNRFCFFSFAFLRRRGGGFLYRSLFLRLPTWPLVLQLSLWPASLDAGIGKTKLQPPSYSSPSSSGSPYLPSCEYTLHFHGGSSNRRFCTCHNADCHGVFGNERWCC